MAGLGALVLVVVRGRVVVLGLAPPEPAWSRPTGTVGERVVLDVRGVRRTFEAENAPVRALRGTDFSMHHEEFVAIMGPSGCGKSTLLNLVAGLDQADEGTIFLAAVGRMPSIAAVAAVVVAALFLGIPTAHHTYLRMTGLERQRLQLIGCAVAIVVEVALVVTALNALVDWPAHADELAAASTVLVPAALVGGTSAVVVRRADRVLVHTVSVTGLTAVVVAVYLVIVIGLGRVPADTESSLLVLSMIAAAVASIAYIPAREHLAESANRLVYGERHPPDEVLRTAPGSSLVVTVTASESELRFEVTDDGPGFDVSTTTAGHGYVNMSDRPGAIGGTVEWRSTPGAGTTIVGSVPSA